MRFEKNPETFVSMHLQGFWEIEHNRKLHDVCVIGGGLVGASAALEIRHLLPKSKILVLERGWQADGASVRNAGFACFGSIGELLADIKQMGDQDLAFHLAEMRFKGLGMLISRLGARTLQYKQVGGYEVFGDRERFEECVAHLPEFNKRTHLFTGTKGVYSISQQQKKSGISKSFPFCISNHLEGQLNPLMMMLALHKKLEQSNIQIIRGCEVQSYTERAEDVSIFTNQGELLSKKLLFCTNGYSKKLIPEVELVPARAQVLITEPINHLRLKGTFHHHEGYYYFRSVGNRILLGGGRHLDKQTETTDEPGLNSYLQDHLEHFLREKLNVPEDVGIAHRWSGIMGMGPEKLPLVKALSKHTFCAIRMGGMGIALGSQTGKEAAEMIVNHS
ncbi:MAG: NAD(P)/FAD-dependent oxidoreductase [Bacteroidota bacterium]